jgi:hypothetical protein
VQRKPKAGNAFLTRLIALFKGRRLVLGVALLSAVLASPALFIGFHLDDYVHRYLLLGLPGADLLGRSYVSLYAIANGDPAQNQWLIEEGFAPWWTFEHLKLAFWRPLSTFTHRVDYALWPNSAVLMHAQSLLWLGAVSAAAALFYRSVLGVTTAAGFAAYLYAVDHAHGLAAGWIANRNALVAVAFGILALVAYDRAYRSGSRGAAVAGVLCYAMGLLGGELAASAWAYLLAHALVLDQRAVKRRALGLLPYAAVTAIWLLARAAMGYGAHGSGLYIDPVGEPLGFALALVQRVPLLVLGQFALPPAETHHFVAPELGFSIFVLSIVVLGASIVTIFPLARADRDARFWTVGALLSLPPASTAYPHNRMLFFVGLGAMALIAILLRDAFARAAWLPQSRAWRFVATPFLGGVVLVHACLSPLLLPLAACSVAATNFITTRGVPSAIAALSSPRQELVIVSAPEYFSVNLIPIIERLRGQPEPARLRALSVGPVPLAVRKLDASVLEVEYEGGLLSDPLAQLYRNARLPMQKDRVVKLHGLEIELSRLTPDGRPAAARFKFEEPLDSERHRFLVWSGDRFVPFALPAIGSVARVPAAKVAFDPSFGFASKSPATILRQK